MTALLAALADAEAMEHFDFEAGEHIGHPVARDEYGSRLPFDHLTHALQSLLVRTQMLRVVRLLEEPCALMTLRAQIRLQGPQDGEPVKLRNEEQVARHHGWAEEWAWKHA